MWYRVSTEQPGPGDTVLCFQPKELALTYVLGWYGETVDLYEIEGTAISQQEENVQVVLTDVDRGINVNIWTGKVYVETVKKIGTFKAEKQEGEVNISYIEVTRSDC